MGFIPKYVCIDIFILYRLIVVRPIWSDAKAASVARR
jgi:hypothetical protein